MWANPEAHLWNRSVDLPIAHWPFWLQDACARAGVSKTLGSGRSTFEIEMVRQWLSYHRALHCSQGLPNPPKSLGANGRTLQRSASARSQGLLMQISCLATAPCLRSPTVSIPQWCGSARRTSAKARSPDASSCFSLWLCATARLCSGVLSRHCAIWHQTGCSGRLLVSGCVGGSGRGSRFDSQIVWWSRIQSQQARCLWSLAHSTTKSPQDISITRMQQFGIASRWVFNSWSRWVWLNLQLGPVLRGFQERDCSWFGKAFRYTKEVKCFKNGRPTSVVLDDFLPCSPNTGLPCYAHVDVQGMDIAGKIVSPKAPKSTGPIQRLVLKNSPKSKRKTSKHRKNGRDTAQSMWTSVVNGKLYNTNWQFMVCLPGKFSVQIHVYNTWLCSCQAEIKMSCGWCYWKKPGQLEWHIGWFQQWKTLEFFKFQDGKIESKWSPDHVWLSSEVFFLSPVRSGWCMLCQTLTLLFERKTEKHLHVEVHYLLTSSASAEAKLHGCYERIESGMP